MPISNFIEDFPFGGPGPVRLPQGGENSGAQGGKRLFGHARSFIRIELISVHGIASMLTDATDPKIVKSSLNVGRDESRLNIRQEGKGGGGGPPQLDKQKDGVVIDNQVAKELGYHAKRHGKSIYALGRVSMINITYRIRGKDRVNYEQHRGSASSSM